MNFDEADALNEALRAVGMRHRALAGFLLAPLGLHPGQEVLLLELARHGSRSQVQLAHASGCEAPTITNSVRKLEAAGLVARRPSPTDGRIMIVELSARGEELIPGLRAAWQELAERSVAGLDGVPVEQLTATLVALSESLSSAPMPPAGPSASALT